MKSAAAVALGMVALIHTTAAVGVLPGPVSIGTETVKPEARDALELRVLYYQQSAALNEALEILEDEQSGASSGGDDPPGP